MLVSFRQCYANPAIRKATATLFFAGVGFSAALPYQSLFMIDELGVGNRTYSIAMFVGAVVSVSASVVLGAVSDRLESRKPIILALSALGIFGYGLVYLVAAVPVVLVSFMLILPVASTLFAQLFAAIRTDANQMDAANASSVITAARTVYSASWITVPPLVAMLVAGAGSLRSVYLVAGLASLACLLLGAGFTARRDPPRPGHAPAYGLAEALHRITRLPILVRVLGVAFIMAAHSLNAILYPLIVVGKAGGVQRDVGLIAGSVALLEIPFMLAWGAALARFSARMVLGIGAGVFAAYLLALSFAGAMWQVYSLLPLCAAGAAAILSVPISYLQDTVSDSPGLGSSLFSVASFVASGVSAVSFAVGSAYLGYSDTPILAALVAAVGVAALLASPFVRLR